jgi:hypothetical protein
MRLIWQYRVTGYERSLGEPRSTDRNVAKGNALRAGLGVTVAVTA